jgi:transposase InsO family protein
MSRRHPYKSALSSIRAPFIGRYTLGRPRRWHNHQRLHGYLDDLPPTEYEQRFYAARRDDLVRVAIP